VADAGEGVAADGTIRTGVNRDRVPAAFEPILSDAVDLLGDIGASLYVYGSVATGAVRPGSSDVDLLTIDFPDAAVVGQRLSAQYADRCRGVEIAAAAATDFAGDNDEAYGFRVFLRHYCIHLAGPDRSSTLPAFPADVRAARGFNGDLGHHLHRWRARLASGTLAADLLGVQAARKTLLAVAGLVSVHDHTWTTDRSRAVRRWGALEPGMATHLDKLNSWSNREQHAAREELVRVLADDGIVRQIVERFATLIGLWAAEPTGNSVGAPGSW